MIFLGHSSGTTESIPGPDVGPTTNHLETNLESVVGGLFCMASPSRKDCIDKKEKRDPF
jgi:hypothetical protein